MFEQALPSWPDLYIRLGERPPRRNRGRCLIHGGDSPTSVSFDYDRGLYHCHVCGAGGDRIDFVMRALDTDFKGALRLFGIEPGRPPAPDPARERQRRIREGLRNWADSLGRQFRDEHYYRFRIEACGLRRLKGDHDDDLGWSLLQIAYDRLGQLEELLDRVDIGRDDERIAAYRELRRVA